jgi:hypothetical protein
MVVQRLTHRCMLKAQLVMWCLSGPPGACQIVPPTQSPPHARPQRSARDEGDDAAFSNGGLPDYGATSGREEEQQRGGGGAGRRNARGGGSDEDERLARQMQEELNGLRARRWRVGARGAAPGAGLAA